MEQSLDINPHLYGQTIFNEGVDTSQYGEDNLFNKSCWKNDFLYSKRWKWTPVSQHWKKLFEMTLKT